MSTTGFHSEWVTIRSSVRGALEHRVLIEKRASFPDDEDRMVARVAAEFVDRRSSGDARIVHVFYDDKACQHNVHIASTNEGDAGLEDKLLSFLHELFGHGNPQVHFTAVKAGNTDSDHYDHMEHLSVGAGVAVNRWKHRDADYQKEVRPPT